MLPECGRARPDDSPRNSHRRGRHASRRSYRDRHYRHSAGGGYHDRRKRQVRYCGGSRPAALRFLHRLQGDFGRSNHQDRLRHPARKRQCADRRSHRRGLRHPEKGERDGFGGHHRLEGVRQTPDRLDLGRPAGHGSGRHRHHAAARSASAASTPSAAARPRRWCSSTASKAVWTASIPT